MSAAVLVLGALYGFLLGGAFASFGCVVSERVPAGRSLGGRSHCGCGRQLTAAENVPVLGWVRVHGRARCCGAVLPRRYVLAELALGILGALEGLALAHLLDAGRLTAGALLGAAALAVAGFGLLLAVTWTRPEAADGV
jgi:leader peptidase (prepilin peptidase)/N-methyltransferase